MGEGKLQPFLKAVFVVEDFVVEVVRFFSHIYIYIHLKINKKNYKSDE